MCICIYLGILFSCLEKEMVEFVGKWMDPENITLSQGTQTQKERNHMFSFIYGP